MKTKPVSDSDLEFNESVCFTTHLPSVFFLFLPKESMSFSDTHVGLKSVCCPDENRLNPDKRLGV